MFEVITFDLWNTIFVNKSYTIERLQFLTQYLKNKKLSMSTTSLKTAFKSSFDLPDKIHPDYEIS